MNQLKRLIQFYNGNLSPNSKSSGRNPDQSTVPRSDPSTQWWPRDRATSSENNKGTHLQGQRMEKRRYIHRSQKSLWEGRTPKSLNGRLLYIGPAPLIFWKHQWDTKQWLARISSTFLFHLAKIFRLWIGLAEPAICHTQEDSQFTGQRQLSANESEKHALVEKIHDFLCRGPTSSPSGCMQVPLYCRHQSYEVGVCDKFLFLPSRKYK